MTAVDGQEFRKVRCFSEWMMLGTHGAAVDPLIGQVRFGNRFSCQDKVVTSEETNLPTAQSSPVGDKLDRSFI